MASLLKPEVSLGVSLAVSAVVVATYQHALPSVADVRTAKPQDTDVNAARKMAAWTSAGLVGAISLIAKDPTVFIVGGAITVALDWWYRHADTVNPLMKNQVTGMSSMNQPAPATTDTVTDYAG